jgi:hypothetical protein
LAAESVATTPRAGEPAELPSPPSAPPENEFGYDTPVAGCFEGKVYALAENTRKLPEEYNTLTQLSVVYACEWNIPQHDWHQGFPNLADRSEWFAIHYSGPFTVKVPGTYRFRTSSDDGTRLFIDGKVVVDNDGVRPMRSVAGTVELSASRHDLTLDYFQGPRYSIAMQVYVTAPGASEHLFTARAERSQ